MRLVCVTLYLVSLGVAGGLGRLDLAFSSAFCLMAALAMSPLVERSGVDVSSVGLCCLTSFSCSIPNAQAILDVAFVGGSMLWVAGLWRGG